MLTGDKTAVFPPVRQLGSADLARCVALSVDRGWSPEQAKWGLLLSASDVFGVDAPDGRGLAGSVTLTRWGPDFAAVGMMLVAARYGRQGLGRTLMEHLLRAAGPDATVTLFATSMGRPLYEKLGFRVVRSNVSFTGRVRPDNSKKRGAPTSALASLPGRVRLATEADLPQILALDRAAFGADRACIVTRLPGFADHIAVFETDQPAADQAAADQAAAVLSAADQAAAVLSAADQAAAVLSAADQVAARHAAADQAAADLGAADQAAAGLGAADQAAAGLGAPGQVAAGQGAPGRGLAGSIAGYAAAWRSGPASTVIGPLVAPDSVTAGKLITELAARAGTPIRLDLDPDRPELPAWAQARGLEPTGRTVVMVRGAAPRRGVPDHLFTPISVALA